MSHVVIRSGEYEATFTLEGDSVRIGRDVDNDVVLPFPFISGHWAVLELDGRGCRFVQITRANPTFLKGKPITEARLQSGDALNVGSDAQPALTLRFINNGAKSLKATSLSQQTVLDPRPKLNRRVASVGIDLHGATSVTIGRKQGAALQLDDVRVSREHATITSIDDGWRLDDLGSSNGTYVNGRRIRSRTLNQDDVIRIGPYRLVIEAGVLRSHDDRSVRLDAVGLCCTISGHTILDDVSFSVLPGQRVAIVGTSGAGKSTLMYALNGSRAPDRGRVRINGTDLYDSFDAVQPLLGYTPQQDIVHADLPVRRALSYSAQLRLPPDVSASEAAIRVDSVLAQLELAPFADLEIRKLSGGQLKRVSVASELLANPGLLFMDEPTTGLDPGLTRKFMDVVNQLAKAGHTLILVTHDVASLSECDLMVFLAAGGRVAFIGSPDEALRYFEVTDLAAMYERVETQHSPEWWQQTFRDSEQGRRMLPAAADDTALWDRARIPAPRSRRRTSSLRQFAVLTRRRAEILVRDRRNLLLLLAQAPIIGLLLALVFSREAFDAFGAIPASDPHYADVTQYLPKGYLASSLPLILAATATWFGAINSAREVVGELPIFLRERQAGLRVLPYLLSKMTVLSVLAAVQVAMLLAVVLLKVDVPHRGEFTYGWLELYVTLLLTAVAGQSLGLMISAAVSTADRAQSLVPIVLIPQIIFVGGPLASRFSYQLSSLTITRWSIEAMKITTEVPYRLHGGFDGPDLLTRWSVLAGEVSLFFLLAAVLVRSKRMGSQ